MVQLTYHILAYYAVFQRIVWLLLQHEVVDATGFCRLITQMNSAFFGTTGGQPPVLHRHEGRHVQPVWLQHWRQAEVQSHALVGIVLVDEIVHNLADKDILAQAKEQNLHALCALAQVVGLPLQSEEIDLLARLAAVYGRHGDPLALQVTEYLGHRALDIEAGLDGWFRRLTAVLGETEEPERKAALYGAMLHCGYARYDALGLAGHRLAQEKLCLDLISWMTYAGNYEAARDLTQRLLALLEGQGRSQEVAEAMYRRGKTFYDEKKWKDAVDQLQQALFLAEQIGDARLRRRCETYIQSAQLFVGQVTREEGS